MKFPRFRIPAKRLATIDYAITAAAGVSLPLLIGTLTGRGSEGSLFGLGAFLVGNSAVQGPYGIKARYLFGTVAAIGIGVVIGGTVSGRPWPAVFVLTVVVAVGVIIPRVGTMFALGAIIAAVRPPVGSFTVELVAMITGGLWITMLFLIPWPHRRLRPFRVAAAAGARALADLIDALTEPEETWEERRRAAADKLKATREACELYPTDDGGDVEPPFGRLMGAFAAALHEIVALRSVMEALRERSSELVPEDELRPAAEALADRIRQLAKAIETGRASRMPEPDPAVLRRAAERVEELRVTALVDRKDPVAAALLDHLSRALHRVVRTVESAEEAVAGGLTVGVTVPRMPNLSFVREFWETLVADVRTRSLRFRRLTRTGVATFIGMVIWVLQPFPHGYWLPITTVICMRFSYGETGTYVNERVAGSAIGAAFGAVLLALAPSRLLLVVLIFISAMAAYALRSLGYVYWVMLNTPLAMMLVDYSTPIDWQVAGERVALTIGGGLIALASARLFWPSSGHPAMLMDRLATLCEAYAGLVRGVAGRLDGADMSLEERFDKAAEAVHDITESVLRLSEEPYPEEERVEALRDVIAAAQRLDDELITVTRLTGGDSVDVGPVTAILDRIAERLEQAAGDLRCGRPPEAVELDVDAQLSDLDDFLSRLTARRRAELGEGTDPRECTELRRSITELAAIRHTLRDLCVDTEDLVRALQRARPSVRERPAWFRLWHR
ncbi:MAG TPA: FUSC family protein [Actinomadura sp.]|nr:FUSC family protein [Actinomadura sp.]